MTYMENNNGEQNFLVIGCGHPRTGTSSTKEAIEFLLKWKCLHYSDEVTKHANLFIKCDLNENSTNKKFKLFF